MLENYPLDPDVNPNFIKAYFLEDTSVCDRLIEHFSKENTEKVEGRIYTENCSTKTINHEVKESWEAYFETNDNTPVFIEYLIELQKVLDEYIKDFPWCNEFAPWSAISSTNLQYYPPGGGFKQWHCERGAKVEPVGSRHLVFMTYLNDVEIGGGTEFFHQKITTPAKKGLTVIWPPDWTHVHRGVIAPKEEKYIITGWLNYLQ
jgi:prolyl 4-hydroxylase